MRDAAQREQHQGNALLFDDAVAFRSWYDAALPRVLGYVYARCGDRQLAEDLTQEAFVEAVRNRDRFEGRSDAVTWVCAIASHRIADHWRREARDERRRLRLVEAREDEREAAAWSGIDDREAVQRALRDLPAAQRATLVLHYLDDLQVAEIATALGRSSHAVESLLARGRDNLRRALGDEEGRP